MTDPRVGAVILTGSVETARLFLGWRPDLPLFAETSGKNAIIVTALADRDQAIRDLVRSAFGHNGQKCSAASLAICEAEVYDDPDFRRQLRDAAASLAVGSAWELTSRITPLTQAPGAALRRALTVLDEGEEWLLEPRPAPDNPQLWSPGIKLGVRPGSFFHRTECFGPVLGLMRAEDLDQAIALANATPFGLTSGIQTLDDREVARWVDRLEAGNLYVNRADHRGDRRPPALRRLEGLVGRAGREGRRPQLRPPARALAPGRAARRGRRAPAGAARPRCSSAAWPWRPTPGERALLRASAASYARAWRRHFSREHDPSAILGERNVFRYRPCRRVIVRGAAGDRWRWPRSRWRPASRACALTVSLPPDSPPAAWLAEGDGVELVVEAEAGFVERLAHPGDAERLRVWAPISTAARSRRQRARSDRHRRARPRQRAPRAPLVRAGAGGLAGPAPLRQRHGARGDRVSVSQEPARRTSRRVVPS